MVADWQHGTRSRPYDANPLGIYAFQRKLPIVGSLGQTAAWRDDLAAAPLSVDIGTDARLMGRASAWSLPNCYDARASRSSNICAPVAQFEKPSGIRVDENHGDRVPEWADNPRLLVE